MSKKSCIQGLSQELSDQTIDEILCMAHIYANLVGPELKYDNVPTY